jgi:hypothetical protein
VASAPLRNPASTTTVPAVRPATSRLRTRNRCRCGVASGGNSLTSSPVRPIRANSDSCARGYGSRSPPATIAMVSPSPASAPRWAAASMPNAPPETTVQPCRTRPSPSVEATLSPYAVALREPTTETARASASSSRGAPSTHSASGGVSSTVSLAEPGRRSARSRSYATWIARKASSGHSWSSGVTSRAPSRCASARSAAARSCRRRASASTLTVPPAAPARSSRADSTGPTSLTRSNTTPRPGSTALVNQARANRTSTADGPLTVPTPLHPTGNRRCLPPGRPAREPDRCS